jgi:DNA-binding transcriptional LysR family regulator
MTINLRQMEVFRAVMVAGGVTNAAKLLRVSQPGISKLLRHFEDVLGVRLFERIKGRLIPTPEAERLFEEIRDLWKAVERAQHLATVIGDAGTSQLRLIVTPSLASYVVPYSVSKLLKKHPKIQVRAEITTKPHITNALLNNDADLGVSIAPIDHPMLVQKRIASGRLICVVSKQHPLAHLSELKLAELTSYPLISYSRDMDHGQIIDDAFLAAGMERHIAIEVMSSQAACWFARQGDGVALIDEFAVAGDSFPDLQRIRLKPEIGFDVNVVTNQFRPPSVVVKEFVALLRENAKLDANRGQNDPPRRLRGGVTKMRQA